MTVGVYGLGRFGSFWAELLARSVPVCAYSRSADRATPPGVRRVGEEELLSQEAVFLCVAISAMQEVLPRIRERLSRDAVVMDTCSVKVHPVGLMRRHLPATATLLGTHPMFGPDSAHGGVSGLPMILCPVRIAARELERWRGFFSSLGLAVTIMSPAEHDREAAFTQGVAHYIGRVLSDLGVRPSPIGTVGYNKLLEIVEQTCNDPLQLFLDLQRYNPYTRDMRARLEKSLRAVMAAIDEGQMMVDRPGGDL
ncbi:MAG: prephenate dehydrogenase/arogenate dehydrogenase family protein [Spirochaetia bacterium]|jgi:prephenate dehydrogenase